MSSTPMRSWCGTGAAPAAEKPRFSSVLHGAAAFDGVATADPEPLKTRGLRSVGTLIAPMIGVLVRHWCGTGRSP